MVPLGHMSVTVPKCALNVMKHIAGTVVSIVIRLQATWPACHALQKQNFCFADMSGSSVGPVWPPVQLVGKTLP